MNAHLKNKSYKNTRQSGIKYQHFLNSLIYQPGISTFTKEIKNQQ